MGTAFATDDDPIHVSQIERAESFQERLNGQKAHGRDSVPEVGDARDPKSPVFDGYAQPDVTGACQPAMMPGPFTQAHRALSEDLVGVLGRSPHHIEGAFNKFVPHEIAKQVAHRVDEHPAWGLPCERLLQSLRA